MVGMSDPEHSVDLAVRAGWMVESADATIVESRVVLIDEGRVADIVTEQDDWSAGRVVDAREQLVTPGLVNGHTHLGLCATRGLTHRGGEPIYDIFWPIERHIRPDDVAAFALVAACESLLAGVTSVFDHYVHAVRAEAAVASVGLRGWIGETVMTTAGPFVDGSLARAESHVGLPRAASSLTAAVVAPHALDTIDVPDLRRLGELADAAGVPLHLHLAQSERERQVVASRDSCTSVELADTLGYLDRPALLAHCSYLDDGDLERLASGSTAVAVYCPTVHSMDGQVQPAAALLAAGGRIAIGTDAPPNDNFSMLDEARTAVVGQHQAGDSFSPRQALAAATSALAGAAGEPLLGSLRVGAPADLVAWGADRPEMRMADDLLNALVMSPQSAHTVIVGGALRVLDGELVDIDFEQIVDKALEHRDALFSRCGLS